MPVWRRLKSREGRPTHGSSSFIARCIAILQLLACPGLATASHLWPIPQREELNGPPLAVAQSLAITYNGPSQVAQKAAKRFSKEFARLLRRQEPDFDLCGIEPCDDVKYDTQVRHGSRLLETISLSLISHDDEFNSGAINESYTLRIPSGASSGIIEAASPYGALHGLQTLTLLIDEHRQQLPHDNITVEDAPDFEFRSLTVDTSRRFFPMTLLRKIVDSMAMAKLNVLHLHLADFARLSVESKEFPELNVGYLSGKP